MQSLKIKYIFYLNTSIDFRHGRFYVFLCNNIMNNNSFAYIIYSTYCAILSHFNPFLLLFCVTFSLFNFFDYLAKAITIHILYKCTNLATKSAMQVCIFHSLFEIIKCTIYFILNFIFRENINVLAVCQERFNFHSWIIITGDVNQMT